MSRGARFLPILLVVVGGALAVRGLVGVQALPQMFDGAKALAEGVAQSAKPAKAKRLAPKNPPLASSARLPSPCVRLPEALRELRAPQAVDIARRPCWIRTPWDCASKLPARRTSA